MESHGSTVPAGFSASVLFQRMSSSVRPVPAMIRAVDTIQQAGEMENKSYCDNFTGENFTKFAVFEPLEKGFSAKLWDIHIKTEMFSPQILPNCKSNNNLACHEEFFFVSFLSLYESVFILSL